ncbi:protein FLOURY 1-like [Gastrolobium bilobum]|uniref:protein FLOURY 1-like n=1 Tax=Gastrolobium bilobum TaxID=150636 RepID=UPI002AB257E3|nr:protein FLOURY 1-like [Gastrolobium bilobum]
MDLVSTFNFLTEFGCGYVLLGCFYRVLNFLGMFLMFGFCFKVLRFGWLSKGSIRFLCDSGGIPRIRLCLEKVVWEVSKPKVAPLEMGCDQNSNSSIKRSSNVAGEKVSANSEDGLEGRDENEKEVCDEDEVLDVMALRKFVKIQRQKANAACAELEEERTASSSSAEEAMAMILRLQNEKSSAEIQANQFRRMAEHELEHDQEVIESLQWTITQQETQRSLLEDQMGIYREELKQYLSDDEINQLELDVSKDLESDPNDSVANSSETESQTLEVPEVVI